MTATNAAAVVDMPALPTRASLAALLVVWDAAEALPLFAAATAGRGTLDAGESMPDIWERLDILDMLDARDILVAIAGTGDAPSTPPPPPAVVAVAEVA